MICLQFGTKGELMSNRFFILEQKTVSEDGRVLEHEFFVIDENGKKIKGPFGNLKEAIAMLESLEISAKSRPRSSSPSPTP